MTAYYNMDKQTKKEMVNVMTEEAWKNPVIRNLIKKGVDVTPDMLVEIMTK